MVVIAGNCIDARAGTQPPQFPAERRQVTAHRFATGKIVAGKEDEGGLLAINQVDRARQALQVFIPIDVKIAYLTSRNAFQSGGQAAHGQGDPAQIDPIDRSPPQAVQRP